MYGILHPTMQPPLNDTPGDDGLEAVTTAFLQRAQRNATARFEGNHGCETVQATVPRPEGTGCTGAIVAHVSTALLKDWAKAGPGTRGERKKHVTGQLQVLLQELSDHDVHGYLALTPSQCEVYGQDLEQLVAETLDRTTFAALGRPCNVHWEGTLVRSLQPPSFVLVISIGG